MATPYVMIAVDEARSTQDLALAELRHRGRSVLVVASRQTGGRGRSGNEWLHAPRGVAASFAFAGGRVEVGGTFSLAVGLAVRDSIATYAGVEVALKWPNDLEIVEGKVGGILVERSEGMTVVGCGLNLWWPDPPDGIAALMAADPGDEVGAVLSRGWVDSLLESGGRFDADRYRLACTTIGLDVTWKPAGRGRAIDIDERGGLVVSTPNGEMVLRSGEITALRPA